MGCHCCHGLGLGLGLDERIRECDLGLLMLESSVLRPKGRLVSRADSIELTPQSVDSG